VVAVIQARMGSTRLPGKILLPLADESVLAHTVIRARRARLVDSVTIATTTAATDDAVVAEADRLGVDAFRGSENDVLSRYAGAARAAGADIVVRITSDCPLLDSDLADQVITRYLSTPGLAYASNTIVRTFPRGLDVEVFSAAALARANADATLAFEREHVTQHFHKHAGTFPLGSVEGDVDLSRHRWTLDTPEDLAFMRAVFAGMSITSRAIPRYLDVVRFLDARPDIVALNASVEQRSVTSYQAAPAQGS
jgi:spore coat polysaccharide biosynthesis protein SpsF